MDARPYLSAILTAFGVPGVVRVSAEEPVETVVVWSSSDTSDAPGGGFSRREALKVMGISRVHVARLPLGSLIDAPELLGGVIRTWRVEAFDRIDVDLNRVLVLDVTED